MSLQLTQARPAQGFPVLGTTWQESCPIVEGPTNQEGTIMARIGSYCY